MEVDKGFMETELRLGLPGNNNNNNNEAAINKKRGFSETVDLKLKIQESQMDPNKNNTNQNLQAKDHKSLFTAVDPAKPPAAKAQVVGWPPVRSYRKNMLAVQKSSSEESEKASFVKVSMDGAPYLRKVDLNMYKGYKDLSNALTDMFSSFTTGNCGSQGMKDFLNESKLIDVNGTDYVPTYEDKDGDWMLVGDVPWEMFVESCKRLRIMKGTEATGLAPRAMEKRKEQKVK